MKLLKSSLSEPLELFLSHLDLERGLSEHTRNSYRYDILQFVELTKIRVFKDVTEKDTECNGEGHGGVAKCAFGFKAGVARTETGIVAPFF